MTSYIEGIYQHSGRRKSISIGVDNVHLYSHMNRTGYIPSNPVNRPTEDAVIENCILDTSRSKTQPSVSNEQNYIYYDVKNKRYVRPTSEPTTYKESPSERRKRIQHNIDEKNNPKWIANYKQQREDEKTRRAARKTEQERKQKQLIYEREITYNQRTSNLSQKIYAAITFGSYQDIVWGWRDLENHVRREVPHIVFTMRHPVYGEVKSWICKSLILNYLPKYYHWLLEQYKIA